MLDRYGALTPCIVKVARMLLKVMHRFNITLDETLYVDPQFSHVAFGTFSDPVLGGEIRHSSYFLLQRICV